MSQVEKDKKNMNLNHYLMICSEAKRMIREIQEYPEELKSSPKYCYLKEQLDDLFATVTIA